ncbi:hypothetical protein PHYSODRAFT_255904 [Phytophthora sojae]|uniref:RxLR effector protein n=1 Tax=Phytophthora sojae (strain P6497) TaxID=1094619 RepID=G5A7W0_PHYSP|nr:hypothetical protein PHYSODRAFT_255904 [Phytophthora sojae]EGZ07986.1 hypothetical protein PHYSODRAFT_255904 [Phytophthora sojae]|eukprot:XP_009536158.1 hypothetical protein PHYSODRAFT_255904 [Phytophthora sojae]
MLHHDNKQNPEAVMIKALSTRYSDDVITQMIITAKKAPNTKDSAGKSSDDAFLMLGLKSAKKTLFDNSELLAWAKYVDDLSESNPKKANLMMTSTLATHYSDEAIAKKVPATESVATKLEAALPQHWLPKNTHPTDALKLFGLHADDAFLTNPALNSWAKYLNDFNKKNPEVKTTMVASLAVNYGEDGLYQMLKVAKEVGTTKKMATDLQTAQLVEDQAEDARRIPVDGGQGNAPRQCGEGGVQEIHQRLQQQN